MSTGSTRNPGLPGLDLRLERVEFGHPDALRLIAEVQQEYVRRYGGEDETPLDPLMFAPPRGSFFVGYLGPEPAASGAWRRRDDVEALGSRACAEIKRMYVAPAHRGLGLARAVLARLESSAAAAGAEVMILETGTAQPEAMGLYESSGYERITPFGHYAAYPSVRCYGKPIGDRSSRSA
jgi:GNAT superfamily N-acetyltransferase